MFTLENTTGYTKTELTAINGEWAKIVRTEQLEPDTDDYHIRAEEFACEVASR